MQKKLSVYLFNSNMAQNDIESLISAAKRKRETTGPPRNSPYRGGFKI